jgi:hypothetical protein
MRVLLASLGVVLATVSWAQNPEIESCIQSNILVSADNVGKEVDSFGFDLTITNNLTSDLGGAIIRYELWSADRPSPLATGYAQFAHGFSGGLLSDETATFREFIGMPARAMELASSASELTVLVSILNVADLDMRPLGSVYDPFALWDDEPSTLVCQRRPD